ncbi:MAG: hypothetical protein KDD64_17230, partial [Bdellovibrionales bacterium]|nr:hypothetical protein [Bdellovibrionales bacterium]
LLVIYLKESRVDIYSLEGAVTFFFVAPLVTCFTISRAALARVAIEQNLQVLWSLTVIISVIAGTTLLAPELSLFGWIKVFGIYIGMTCAGLSGLFMAHPEIIEPQKPKPQLSRFAAQYRPSWD